MSKEDGAASGANAGQKVGEVKAVPAKTTKVFGVEFPCGADDVLDSREYPDRVVVVTQDGQKLSLPKPAKAAK
jgi:hypothetical protein